MRVKITTSGFARDSDFGEPLRTTWDSYQYWREIRGFFLLIQASDEKKFEIVNANVFPEWQRQQLSDLLNECLLRK